MFQNLDIFKNAFEMARHAGQRQAIATRNIANVDTPDFKAKDLTPFHDLVSSEQPTSDWRTTNPKHFPKPDGQIGRAQIMVDDTGYQEPNGNTVSIETELLRAADIEKQHNRALSIYRSGMNILRGSLGK